jgi:hypothetical protein
MQLRKRLQGPFMDNAGGNFAGDSKDIAKEILILRKELGEDEQNNVVLSGIKVVDRGQVWFINRYKIAAQGAGLPAQGQGQANMLALMPAQH